MYVCMYGCMYAPRRYEEFVDDLGVLGDGSGLLRVLLVENLQYLGRV